MKTYSARTADQVWRTAVADLLAEGSEQELPSRLGPMREMLHVVIAIQDPIQRWVVSRSPAINPAFALAEVVALVNGRDDTAFLSHWFPGFPKFVGRAERQHGAYGARLRFRQGFDQLELAYRALSENPSSRQVVLQIWNAPDDLPGPDGAPRSDDIPCNLLSLLKVRNGRLEWLQVVRSNDIDRGVPYNFVQFTTLQEIMAGWLGLESGTFVQVIDSLHFYPELSSRLSVLSGQKPALNTDSLRMSYENSRAAFAELGNRMDGIIAARRKGQRPTNVVSVSLPQAFENVFYVLAADDARRHGEFDAAVAAMHDCDNPALRQLWRLWTNRTEGGA